MCGILYHGLPGLLFRFGRTLAAEQELTEPRISAGAEVDFGEIIPVRISLMLLVQIRGAQQQLKSDQKL